MIGQCNFIVVYAYNYIHILFLNVSYSYMIIENFIDHYLSINLFVHVMHHCNSQKKKKEKTLMVVSVQLYHCEPYFC